MLAFLILMAYGGERDHLYTDNDLVKVWLAKLGSENNR